MEKKKLTCSALAALMIAGSVQFTALAEMPVGTAVIGDKAYDLNYLPNATQEELDEITAAVVAQKEIYVKDFSGSWVYNSTNEAVADVAKEIPAVVYKDVTGATTDYKAGDDTVEAVEAGELKVTGVSAINATTLQVTLKEAVKAVDAAQITVKDASNKAIEVASAELASWDANGKTVIVTLASKTTTGTLYTLTAGETSAKFGGKAADSTKPTVTSVVSKDYNKVEITFSEAVKLDAFKATITEKYGNKSDLAITNIAYVAGKTDKVELTTADQKKSTLYGVVIESTTDFAGNVMDKDTNETFVGIGKSTDKQTVAGAKSIDFNKIYVELGENIDANAIEGATFKVEKMYGDKAVVTIASAAAATKDDAKEYNTSLTDDQATDAAKKAVVLTIDGALTANTLYKTTVSNLGTLYGQPMSTTTTDTYKTFVGTAKPSKAFTYTISVVSNTEVNVKFENKVVEEEAENLANYAIAKAYGDKAALAVEKAELQSDNKTVKLTIAKMSNDLYKMTINNINDIYGNAVKTESNANIVSFAGQTVKAKITKINSITRTNDTQITVTFDQNVGATATDVSHYTIDNSIGYPEKAELVTGAGNEAKVKLTIPKTNPSTVYTLTVKGLENADGILMDTAGVKSTFVGQGLASTKPQLVAAMPLDEQTLKIYFDRDVKSNDIDGHIWNSSDNTLTADRLRYKFTADYVNFAGATDLRDGAYVYQDSTEKSALIVRYSTAKFNKSGTKDQFKLSANTTYVDADHLTVSFAYSDTDVTAPKIDAVAAKDNRTLMIYFSSPVKESTVGNADFEIYTNSDLAAGNKFGTNTKWTVKKINDTQYELGLGTELATVKFASQSYWLKYVGGSGIKDATNNIDLAVDKDKAYASREFAGSSTDAAAITDVNVNATSARTIEVYFPTLMDTTIGGANSATNVANYKVFVNAGAEAKVVFVTYDKAQNKATLHLNADLTTPASAKYYVGIKDTVKTISGSTGIKTDVAVFTGSNDGIKREFAYNTTADAKPAISGVEISNDRTRATITFDKDVAFGNVANLDTTDFANGTTLALDKFSNGTSGDGFDATATGDVKGYFDVKDETANSAVTVLNAVRKANNKVEFTFSQALTAGNQVSFAVKAGKASTDTIYSLNGMAAESDSSKVSKVVKAVANLAASYDTTAPVIVSIAEGTDANNNGVLEVNDTLVITFNENVQLGDELATTGNSLATVNDWLNIDLGGGTTNEDLTSGGAATFDIAVNNNVVTVTVKTAALSAAIVAGTTDVNINDVSNIKDMNNNESVAASSWVQVQ